jgi:non-homologous end joining protein Ku
MRIEFGLIGIACRRESAVESPPELKNLCVGQEGKEAHGPTPLKQDPSYCVTCGPVEKDRLVKGHGSGTTWTVLSTEEVDALSEVKAEFGEHVSLKLVAHPAAEFLTATETGENVYYVTPEPTDVDHYALLAALVAKHPELAFTGLLSLSTGGKAKLWLLRSVEGVLILEQRVPETSRKPAPAVTGTVNEALLAMVEGALAEHFVTEYSAEAYEDRYTTALTAALGAGTATDSATPVAKTTDDELMAKLAALGGAK